jgi:RNA ligase
LKITELFTHEQFQSEVQYGYVKLQKHPFLPLIIANYTDKATYERRWNAVTIHCRGLIFNSETSELVARGPRKFFNYGEPSAKEWPLHTPVRVSRKEDGSLGIGWCYEDGEGNFEWGIATRGSFTSEQAGHATALVKMNESDNDHYAIMAESIDQYRAMGESYIGEIVYPDNRIVLDYSGLDAVIPLGTVGNHSGLITWRPWGYNKHWGDSEIMTLADALSLPIPDDEEGYVLDILNDDGDVIDHLKLKGDKYKELHSAIFGLSEKAIWEHSCAGTVHAFIEGLPDELQGWARDVNTRLVQETQGLYARIRQAERAVREVCGVTTRKMQAQYLLKYYPDVASPVFAELDKNWAKQTDWINKQLKPGHVPFKAVKENA